MELESVDKHVEDIVEMWENEDKPIIKSTPCKVEGLDIISISTTDETDIEKDMLWAGTDDGRIHYTKDGGNNWIEVSNLPGDPKNSWLVQIKASNKNKGKALMVVNDYGRFNS